MDPKKMAVLLSLNLTLYTVILAPPGGKFILKTYFLPAAEPSGLWIANVTVLVDTLLLRALALRYDLTDTIQSC